MKILLVRRGSIENVDGISTYIIELGKALKKRGHEVLLISGYLRSEYRAKQISAYIGVPVIPGPSTSSPQAWTKRLLKVVDLFKPDIVHLNNAILHFKLYKAPVVMTYHGTEALLSTFIQKTRQLFYLYLALTTTWSKKIIVSNKKLKNELFKSLKFYNPSIMNKLVVVPLGINISQYRNRYKALPEREMAVVHIGTRRQKNLLTTLMAMRLLWKEGIKAKLYITGPKTRYLDRCLSILKPQERGLVHYLGVMDKNDYINLLCNARAYILPSYLEGFSISTLEALSCGTPVVVSDAIPEDVAPHEYVGFRVKNPNDYRSFANYLKLVLLDIYLWVKMSSNALKWSSRYEISKIISRIIKIYELVLIER